MKTASTTSNKSSQPIYITHDISPYDSKEVKELKEIIKLRDNEISILVGMLKKEKKTEYRPFTETYEPDLVWIGEKERVSYSSSATPAPENSFSSSSSDRAGNQRQSHRSRRETSALVSFVCSSEKHVGGSAGSVRSLSSRQSHQPEAGRAQANAQAALHRSQIARRRDQ